MRNSTFYQIKSSTDLSLVGCYDQIQQVKRKHPLWPNRTRFDDGGSINPNFEFAHYLLEKSARITDWISATPLTTPLAIVSNGLLEFVESLNVYGLQHFNARISTPRTELQGYNIINIMHSDHEYVDWGHSSAYKTENYHRTKIEQYSFTDISDYLQVFRDIRDNSEYGFLPKLKLRAIESKDIFRIKLFGIPSGLICTESTKSRIENLGFTGMQFVDITEKYFSPEVG